MDDEGKGEIETVMPTTDFEGYPFGDTPVQFRSGVESQPIPKDYAQMLRDKKLVAETMAAEQPLPDQAVADQAVADK